MRYDFDNKVAIVTGGAKGIGKEVVRGIHNGGGTVAGLDIDDSAGKNLLGELGNNDRYYHMDQANLTGPFNTVKAIWEYFKNNKRGRIVNVSSVAGEIGG